MPHNPASVPAGPRPHSEPDIMTLFSAQCRTIKFDYARGRRHVNKSSLCRRLWAERGDSIPPHNRLCPGRFHKLKDFIQHFSPPSYFLPFEREGVTYDPPNSPPSAPPSPSGFNWGDFNPSEKCVRRRFQAELRNLSASALCC